MSEATERSVPTKRRGRWVRAALAAALGTAALIGSAVATSSCSAAGSPPASAPSAQQGLALRGLYTATAPGPLGDLAIDDDGGYVLRPSTCRASGCLETGRATLDTHAKVLTLAGALGAPTRTLAVEVLTTTSSSTTTLTPKNQPGGGSLVEADAGALVEAGASTNDGSVDVLETIEKATLDGQPVELVVHGSDGGDGGMTPNDTSPPYPGSIPGTLALRAPSFGETTTVHPGGNSVTVATPNDPAFETDPQLAARYAGVANVYNSHGMPGMLVGGVPGDVVRGFLRSDQPLIVASCFSAANMSGGSTIRRLVSAYGDDPSVASRVYGCTGWASALGTSALGCSGVWLDANHQAVPLVERERLGLAQMSCRRNVIVNGQPDWSDCVAAN